MLYSFLPTCPCSCQPLCCTIAMEFTRCLESCQDSRAALDLGFCHSFCRGKWILACRHLVLPPAASPDCIAEAGRASFPWWVRGHSWSPHLPGPCWAPVLERCSVHPCAISSDHLCDHHFKKNEAALNPQGIQLLEDVGSEYLGSSDFLHLTGTEDNSSLIPSSLLGLCWSPQGLREGEDLEFLCLTQPHMLQADQLVLQSFPPLQSLV